MSALPCAGCGGACCKLAGFTSAELRRARLYHGGRYPAGAQVLSGIPVKPEHGGGMGHLVVQADGVTCAFLTAEGRCAIHPARPKVCRDYGEVPALPCQRLHPKQAERAAERLFTELVQIKRREGART